MNREHINKVIEISIDAGKAIMDIYKTDFDHQMLSFNITSESSASNIISPTTSNL